MGTSEYIILVSFDLIELFRFFVNNSLYILTSSFKETIFWDSEYQQCHIGSVVSSRMSWEKEKAQRNVVKTKMFIAKCGALVRNVVHSEMFIAKCGAGVSVHLTVAREK